jgi:hypothetical protein
MLCTVGFPELFGGTISEVSSGAIGGYEPDTAFEKEPVFCSALHCDGALQNELSIRIV